MAHLSRTRGIVLRLQDYAETDRIAVLLTPDEGRLDVLAKGARRLEKSSGAALDISNLVDLIYYRRSGLALLKEVSLVRSFPGLRADLERLQVALEGLAWPLRLIPKGQPEPTAFRLTWEFLSLLEKGTPPSPLELGYRLQLLAALGHGPHLAGCVSCGREEELTWAPEAGGFLCRDCGGQGEILPLGVVRTLQALARFPLLALGRVQASAPVYAKIRELIDAFARVQLAR